MRIYLPRAMTQAIAAVALSERSESLPIGDETVLVVEDNDSMRKTVVRQLTNLGYRAIEAASSHAALAILDRPDQAIDLLFTDMVMPGHMDGQALARTAIASRPGLKVMLTSGFPGTTLNGAGKAEPEFRLLSKPYRKAELAHAIRSALDASTHAIR